MESVEPLQILRLTLGWIGTMNLTKRAACWFQWFDRLDHESGMSSKAEGLGDASKQRGQ